MNFLICFNMICLHHIIAIWTWKPLNILLRCKKAAPPPPRNSDGVMLSPCKQLCLIYAKVSMTGPNPSHQHSMVSDTAKLDETERVIMILSLLINCYKKCTDLLLLTIKYLSNLQLFLLFSDIPMFRGLCPQGVLFRGLCPQGVLSAGGHVLDSVGVYLAKCGNKSDRWINIFSIHSCYRWVNVWVRKLLNSRSWNTVSNDNMLDH